MAKLPTYDETAVNQAIAASRPKIGGEEAKLIHALLKGKHGPRPKASQPALFELKEDCRPATERTAAGRYLEPSLFTLPQHQNRRNGHAKSE